MRAHSGLRDAARNSSGRKSTEAVKQIVQGIGVRGGGAADHPAWKIQGKSVFRARSSFSKILKDKKYFNRVKNSRADFVLQGKRRLFKILKDKKYIFNRVNSGHTLFFRASTSCSKILNVKTMFNTVKNFRENSVFRASASYSKILISMQWKFSRQTLFFRASAGCSKFWRIKNTNCIQWIQDALCFSGQAKVAQTSWK